VTASWGASTDNVAVVGYDYQVNGGAFTSLGNVLSLNLTGLFVGSPVNFAVRARDAAGNVSSVRAGSVTTVNPITSAFTNGVTFQGFGGESQASALFTLNSNGTIGLSCFTCNATGGGSWLAAGTPSSNYEASAGNSCPFEVGSAFDTWVSADASPAWGVSINDPTNEGLGSPCVIGVSIRAKANPSVILGTASLVINIFTGQ
jgi:hypothetical protein